MWWGLVIGWEAADAWNISVAVLCSSINLLDTPGNTHAHTHYCYIAFPYSFLSSRLCSRTWFLCTSPVHCSLSSPCTQHTEYTYHRAHSKLLCTCMCSIWHSVLGYMAYMHGRLLLQTLHIDQVTCTNRCLSWSLDFILLAAGAVAAATSLSTLQGEGGLYMECIYM